MVNRELYIDGKLCDLPLNYSPRLNRVLINPSEMAMKDAQYSYSITLPPTSRNNEALGYVGVEEVGNKFNRRYTGELIINGVRIFKGYFRLSEVSDKGYKGNLYKPNARTSKEIFPTEKWADMKGYYIPFTDFASSVSDYNRKAADSPQPAIFPYVLYGLLPKVLKDGTYGERDVWDDRVNLSRSHIPPSANVLSIIKKSFEVQGCSLTGDVFSDECLSEIYVSYKNEASYEQPWNSQGGKITMSGTWKSASRGNKGIPVGPFEERVVLSSEGLKPIACAAVSFGTNAAVTVIEDPFNSINDGVVTVPFSGYYKINLKASFYTSHDGIHGGKYNNGVYHIVKGAIGGKTRNVFELRLMRGGADLSGLQMDTNYYRDNFPQGEKDTDRHFPAVSGNTGFLIVDEMQDPRLVAGISLGDWSVNSVDQSVSKKGNPLDTRNVNSSILIKSPFPSWSDDAKVDAANRNLTIAPAPGYMLYRGGAASPTEKYRVFLVNAPASGASGTCSSDWHPSESTGTGELNVIAWLNRGECLTLMSVSASGATPDKTEGINYHGWDFNLELTAFRSDRDWVPLSYLETGSLPELNWNDETTFDSDIIDLFGFMPVAEKVSDFIDNVCKAFNLRLTDLGRGRFSLDKATVKSESDYINLDGLGAMTRRVNQSLNMPSGFKLSFTVNEKEEGYLTGVNGGESGTILTEAIEENVTEQKSNFSYNWFKEIAKGGQVIHLPVISEHEVWTEDLGYEKAMERVYTNLGQRFWFYKGTFEASFTDTSTSLAIVTDNCGLELSYENKGGTLLNEYFKPLVNASSHYTEVECFLTPDMYESLNGRNKAIFNGDVYYVAEISGYDPAARNKTKIKLIRRV